MKSASVRPHITPDPFGVVPLEQPATRGQSSDYIDTVKGSVILNLIRK